MAAVLPIMAQPVYEPTTLKFDLPTQTSTIAVTEVPLSPLSEISSPPLSPLAEPSDEESRLKQAFTTASSSGHITTPTITTCLALASFYESSSRYSDAISTYRTTLSQLWPSFDAAEDTPCKLPALYSDVSVSTAGKLASAYKALGNTVHARLVFVNIFRASRARFGVESAKTVMAMEMLAGFYVEEASVEELVGLYEEMLFAFKKVLGKEHRFTLEVRARLEKLNAFEMYRGWW